MKRIVALAAAATLSLGVIPWAANAQVGHVYQPVGDTGVAVGIETPSSQGRSCVFVQTPDGWYAAGVGAGLYYQEGVGTYDAHNQTETDNDGSICDGDPAHE